MTQEILFDCVTCDRRFECALRDVPNYCPKRDGETRQKHNLEMGDKKMTSNVTSRCLYEDSTAVVDCEKCPIKNSCWQRGRFRVIYVG